MPRIRSVKPEFFTSEAIARIRHAAPADRFRARLTFVGLWTYVDDEGRGRDNPLLIRAAVWPLDEEVGPEEVEADLELLAQHRRIVRYAAPLEPGGDPVRLLAVLRFTEHQKPNRPTKSTLPAPPPHATQAHTEHHPVVPTNRAEARNATSGVREGSVRTHGVEFPQVATRTGVLTEPAVSTPGALTAGVVEEGRGVGGGEGLAGGVSEPGPPRCVRHSGLPPEDPGPKCIGCQSVRVSQERREAEAAAAREAESRAARVAEQRAARNAPRPSGARGPALARQILAEAKAAGA